MLLEVAKVLCVDYNNEYFLKFFKEQFKKYSPDEALDVEYTDNAGFFTVCKNDIRKNENVFEIPPHLTVSTFDPFDDKKEILKILKSAEEEIPLLKKDIGWVSKTILVLRYMIELTNNRDDPFGTLENHGEESRHFHKV